MRSVLLIRLKPRGPWRYGPADGAHDSVDALYRSDRLYSAVTLAMQKLGFLDEWLAATALSDKPAVSFSSLFPFQGDTLFAIPPASIWPPPTSQITAPNPVFLAKIRWKSASFVPLSVIDTLLTGGSILADQWLPDLESGCLLRRDRPSSVPMRTTLRRTVPVDRLTHQTYASSTSAAVEFESGSGLWALARFADDSAENAWRERVEGAFRLLADSGLGGRRSSGWGQSHTPEFTRGTWPAILLPRLARASNTTPSSRYWLLSLYVPAAQDTVDWSGGAYQLLTRSGRVENGASSGTEKKSLRMVAEGSVLAAISEPAGTAIDVAPENFAHPVYRSGFALALQLPEIVLPELSQTTTAVEEQSAEEAVIEPPCQTQVSELEEETNHKAEPEAMAEKQTDSLLPEEREFDPEPRPAASSEEAPPAEHAPEQQSPSQEAITETDRSEPPYADSPHSAISNPEPPDSEPAAPHGEDRDAV